jgi:hypothetical protein
MAYILRLPKSHRYVPSPRPIAVADSSYNDDALIHTPSVSVMTRNMPFDDRVKRARRWHHNPYPHVSVQPQLVWVDWNDSMTLARVSY